MASIDRAAKRSLDALSSGGDDGERIEEIDSIRNPMKRVALRALHDYVRRNPEFVANRLQHPYIPRDMRYLGQGATSTVYTRMNYKVVKVDKNVKFVDQTALPLPDAERPQRVLDMRREHGVLASYFGSQAVPQEVGIINHHYTERERRAIQTTQAYHPLDFLRIFEEAETHVLTGPLDAALSAYPRLYTELTDFTAAGQRLLAEHGLAVDTNGVDNFGVSRATGRLVIIDGQPVTRDNPFVVDTVAGQLHNLEAALQDRRAA